MYLREREKKGVLIINPTRKPENSQLLDSPGAKERSTANIAGCTSKVGSGSSGLTSSSPAFGTSSPNTLGLLILLPNLAEVGEEVGDPNVAVVVVDDVLQRPDPEPGVGLEMEDTNEVGERIDKSPAAEKDLLCDPIRCRGGDLGECKVEVISIRPPPLIERLSNADLTALRVWTCSGVGRAPETGVMVTAPVS